MSLAADFKSIWRSATFRTTLFVSLCFVLIMAVVGGLYGGFRVQQANKAEMGRIDAALDDMTEFIKYEGLDALVAEYSRASGQFWPNTEAPYVLADQEALVLVMQSGQPLVGFRDLAVSKHQAWLPFTVKRLGKAPETFNVRTHLRQLDSGVLLVAGLPRSDAYYIALDFLKTGLLLLLLVVLPLTIICGFFTSSHVFRRLNALSASVGRIAEGELESRAPVSAANDEFDQLAEDINVMLLQIKVLMRNLESVSVGVAHDLKTPLANLDQRLQRIATDLESPEKIEQHLAVGHEHIQTLLGTFNALLRLGEIESGKRREGFQTLSLSELVEDLAETYEAVFSERGRQLSISIMPGIQVLGDHQLLEQVVSNLLENILEHANPDGQAWVRLQPHAQGAILQIGDDGPGIPKAQQHKVFERFYRLDRSRNTPGNGLGLSLVASIAKLHNASFELHSHQPGTVIDLVFSN